VDRRPVGKGTRQARLQLSRRPAHVERGAVVAGTVNTAAQGLQARQLARQRYGSVTVLGVALRHQLGQAQRGQQTAARARDEGPSAEREHRRAGLQPVAGGGASVVRMVVQEQVGQRRGHFDFGAKSDGSNL
jgi:hypothetical protein